jgi:hypothetical protein
MISVAFAGEPCQYFPGVDHKLPAVVKEKLKEERMEGFQLVNRTVCGSSVTWYALPPDFPPSQAWPPGVMKLVSWNVKKNEVELL